MAGTYIVLLNGTRSIDLNRLKAIFDEYKDWLMFGTEGWLVYTGLTADQLRTELKEKLQPDDPSIMVFPTDLSGWSVYAKPLPRKWLKKDRTIDYDGR